MEYLNWVQKEQSFKKHQSPMKTLVDSGLMVHFFYFNIKISCFAFKLIEVAKVTNKKNPTFQFFLQKNGNPSVNR